MHSEATAQRERFEQTRYDLQECLNSSNEECRKHHNPAVADRSEGFPSVFSFLFFFCSFFFFFVFVFIFHFSMFSFFHVFHFSFFALKHRFFQHKSSFLGTILGERRRRRKNKKEERKKNASYFSGLLPQSHAHELFVIRVRGNPSLRQTFVRGVPK